MAGKSAMRGKTEAVPRSTKATKRLSVDELVAFMSLPIFYELRTAVDVGILLFDDLDEYDLPEGYSKEDIWRILLAVRKQAAVFVPEDPERTADMWMVTTSSLSFNTEMLEVRSKEDSSLARSLRDMQGSPFVTRFIERTLMRGLADEGIAMDEERVHELFAGAPPLTSLDQLVANYFRLSSDCDSLARRAVTHGLIETLYYELSEGVDLSELPERVLAPLDPRLAPPESQVLMDLANKSGGLVIGTGDLSELALGWATYNGDHMSMYAVNASIPKTLVRHLVAFVSDDKRADQPKLSAVLDDILDTPVSPELLPAVDGKIAQKTEDLVGPYELHDFFLYYALRWGFGPKKVFRLALYALGGRYERDFILKWLKNFYRRFFNQQFKRSCLPDGPKVGTVTLSPRGDWRMPSDAVNALWAGELEEL